MEQQTPRIEKNSRLNHLVGGDEVNIIGISSPEQIEKGFVTFSDQQSSHALIATYNPNEDIILISRYKINSSGQVEAAPTISFDRNHVIYQKYKPHFKQPEVAA